MRTSLTALLPVLLLGAPAAASGETILFSSSDESSIEYGMTSLVYHGLPHFLPLRVERDGVLQDSDWDVNFVGYEVLGSFLGKTSETDGSGHVLRSTYYYEGLPFEINFIAENFTTGETRLGSFIAPILGPIEVLVDESDIDDSVRISLELGPGLFDESIARALDIRRHTIGGRVFDPFLTFGDGGPNTAQRFAWEGAPELTIEVAEPASLSLVGVAAVGVIRRARKSSSLRAKRTPDA
jgi:hypothetical protein